MLSDIATVLLVPPVNLVVLALIGMALARRWPGAGRGLTLVALALLLLLALPIIAASLLAGLERDTTPAITGAITGATTGATTGAAAQAIVVLGADARQAGPRVEQTDIGPLTLERVRGAAALARASGLPVLTTGGEITVGGAPLAVLMARSLAVDFGIATRWVEPQANTTWENAGFAAKILRRDGIGTVLLVTHAWHMRRALIAFRAAGLVALPAPLPADPPPRLSIGSMVPRMTAWQRSYYALHEWIGGAWYAWRARAG